MIVSDVHHVSINVTDVDRALGFYVDLLGMEVLPRPDFPFPGAWLGVGATRQLHLIQGGVPADTGQHVAFAVDDLDAAVATIREAGVRVTDPRPVGDTALRQSFLHDPDGNRLELSGR